MSSTRLARHIFKLLRFFAIFTAAMGFASAQDLQPVQLQKCWEYPATNLSEKGFASDNQRIYFPETGGRVGAVSLDKGAKLWESELGGEVISNVVLNETGVFVVTRSGETTGTEKPRTMLRSLSKETGITNWVTEISDSVEADLIISGAKLVVVGSNGNISAAETSGGAFAWKRAIGSEIKTIPDSSAESIVFGTSDKKLIALSNTTGDDLFQQQTQFLPTAVYFIDQKTLAWGDERGNLTVTDLASKSIEWTLKRGAAIVDISKYQDDLVITSLDDFVYFVDSSTGHVMWKKRQKDRVFKPAIYAEKFIVLPSRIGRETSIIESRKGKIMNELVAPDGSLILQPAIANADQITLATTVGISAYRLNGCAAK